MRRIGLGLVLFLLGASMMQPLASGSLVPLDVVVHFQNDGVYNYTYIANLANVSDESYSNYNLTWLPFLNEHGAKGKVITPFFAPSLFAIDESIATIEDLNVASRFRLDQSAIMDGIGEWYLRLPVDNLSSNAVVRVHLYRAYTKMNVTGFKDNKLPTFDQGEDAYDLIVNHTGTVGTDPNIIQGNYPIAWLDEVKYVDVANTSSQESYVAPEAPDMNYGAQAYMMILENHTVGSAWKDALGLFEFTGLTGSIPWYSKIVNATAWLYEFYTRISNDEYDADEMRVYPILESWDESTVTWNTRPDWSSTQESETNVSLEFNYPIEKGIYEWVPYNITESIQQYYDKGDYNGNMFRADAVTWLWRKYVTHEHPTASLYPYLNVSYQEPDLTKCYNFTYLKLWAPIHPNEWYILHLNIDDPDRDEVRLLWTPSDFADDKSLNTWLDHGESYGDHTYVGVDLDTSIFALTGMPNGISGMNLTAIPFDDDNDEVLIKQRRDYNYVIQAGDYASMVVPIINTSASDAVDVDYYIYCTINSVGRVVQSKATYAIKGTLDKVVVSASLNAYAGQTLEDCEWWLYLNHTYHRIFLTSSNNSVVERGLSPVAIYEQAVGVTLKDRVWFNLFGWFSVGDVQWVLSNYEIVVLSIEEPYGEANITSVLADYWGLIYEKEEAGEGEPILFIFIDWLRTDGFGAMIEWLRTANNIVWNQYILGTGEGHYLFSPLTWLELFDFVMGIGAFVWTVIEVVIEAIEWFGYWAIKIINMMIVGTIYFIGVLSVSTIASGAHKGVKHRDMEVFVDTVEKGWEKIWAIFLLIISLMLFAVSIVSAVIPF